MQRSLAVQSIGSSVCLSIVLLAAIVVAGTMHAADPSPPVCAAVAKLGWELLRASEDGNAIVSPVSIWESLAMTHAGARGQTAAEIAGVLGMPHDSAVISAAAKTLRQTFADAKGKNSTLSIASRLWVQNGKEINDSFTTLLKKNYGAATGIVDFKGAAEASRAEINGWVSEQTEKKIDELLKVGSITSQTQLVLTNAVYMKAPWAKTFDKAATRPAPFLIAAGNSIDVPFMHRDGELTAGKVGVGKAAATVCEIPYDGNRLVMIVIVPDAMDGVLEVLNGFGGDWRAKWMASAANSQPEVRSRTVHLVLPRWIARQSLSLKTVLQSMGLQQAFQPGTADFSGIDGGKELFLSSAMHEGFVDVSEEGTAAAAATAIVVGVTSIGAQTAPLEVRADRPFLWAVIEQQTGGVLFAGLVRDPR